MTVLSKCEVTPEVRVTVPTAPKTVEHIIDTIDMKHIRIYWTETV